ncbi:MAG TPA: serine/threonine-protein kinase [Dokdonella sp.]|uniref:serine/threonine-protein kinase n=1 Tax=Dokdonella sp. TaxID=2291710 RepID=UPI002D80FD5E|nr:serine/threonine-protein kinase [Dokdonella sp.]HET9033866.1 serine/threonine-protein kinase [Dokdonella sp.]
MNHDKDPSATAATEVDGVLASAGDGASLPEGTRLGAYRIRRALGEGGMGQVYLAEQTAPVHRDVALKLIRQQIASPLALAWFEVERQALAQMQHPAIAQIFDAGTTDEGHAYIAMEYVEGTPASDYCRSRALSRDQRIALFVRICQGVQHAHQKGVIHRDLKPENVLVSDVDGLPLPKIIDFGIAIGGNASSDGAKVESSHVDRAGTAIYMSPEQAGLNHRDIDTRSDVYSLGVMLCEILTGSDARTLTADAHDSTHAPQETLLTALGSGSGSRHNFTDSGALYAAAHNLPSELRAILRKALATERADRYDSAAALAEDLERFREHRPVSAIPSTRTYRMRSFIARHRLGIAAVSLILMAILVGAGLALHGLGEARESARVAHVEAVKADRVAQFVRTMLGGIDPDRARGMDNKLMHMILDAAAKRVGSELVDQPDVRAEIESTIAGSYSSLGDYDLARIHYDAALDAAHAAELPHAEIARIQARSAINLENQGRLKEALDTAQAAFAEVATLPVENRDRLIVESTLAGIEASSGKPEEARTRFHRVLALQRTLFGDDSDDVLNTLSVLTAVDLDTNHLDEAQPLLEELLGRYRTRYGDEHSKTFSAVNGLAIVALEQKRYADAEKLLTPQLPMIEHLFGKDHPVMLRLISNLGGAIRQQGRNEEARPFYERAASLSQEIYGPKNPTSIVAESNLSLLLRDSGQLAEAETHARNAVKYADIVWSDNGIRGIMHRELATILIAEKKYEDAETELNLAWGVLSQAEGYGPQHPRSQDVVDTYLSLYQAWKKPKREAEWRVRKLASR